MRALVLPILVPLSTAAILLLAPKRPLLQRWIGADRVDRSCSAAPAVVFRRVDAAGIQVLQLSGWPAPFGITLVADLLAAMLAGRRRRRRRRDQRRRHSPAWIRGAKRSATTR